MKKHPIWSNGEKAVREDIAAAALVAGTADDAVRGSLAKIPIEQTDAKGYVQPWRSGPIVVPGGADGTLTVRPFRMFKSATGAVTNVGTEDADEAAATHEDVVSAYYSGGSATVQTPPPWRAGTSGSTSCTPS